MDSANKDTRPQTGGSSADTTKLSPSSSREGSSTSDVSSSEISSKNKKWPQVDPATVGPVNKVRIAGLGYYLPPARVATTEVEARMATKPLFSLEDLTGIKERRYANGSESGYEMAVKACRNCLANAGAQVTDIDAIVFVAISRVKEGYTIQFEPSLAIALKTELGMGDALAFDISNACAGMTTGLNVIEQMIRAGRIKRGLVVSGEFISPIAETAMREVVRPIDRQMASLTVGDSATAVLLEESPTATEGIEYIDMVTIGEHAELCVGMPSESGPGVAMYTQSSKLQSEALKRVPLLMEDKLRKYGMFVSCYDWIIPHQTSIRAIQKGLQIIGKGWGGRMTGADERYFAKDSESVVRIISKYGNTSSTSHFVALCEAIHSGQIKAGDRIILMIQASGITLGTISVTLGNLKVAENFDLVTEPAKAAGPQSAKASSSKPTKAPSPKPAFVGTGPQ